MKNKLYVYGDSFSTNYSTDGSHVDKEFSWPYLLRDELGLEIVDQGHAGISNQGLLQMIYRNFNPNDAHTVIIGLTFFNRTYDFYKNGGVDILHNTKEQLLEKGIFDYEIDFYTKRLEDEDGYRRYVQQLLEQYLFIFKIMKQLNINFHFWCLDSLQGIHAFDVMKSQYKEHFIPNPNGEDAWFKPYIDKKTEWWQKNSDRHFSKFGHSEFFQYLYGYIQKDLI